jgi:hypothetical protein
MRGRPVFFWHQPIGPALLPRSLLYDDVHYSAYFGMILF